ncbi:hypothetical protein AK812_SmicGene13477 [Symbiodinium microadriaticum]|uniref:Uncharacterized protein n=1 Tax=Symbiodinium microadriaticum TaxID=2951 RepID=A0A1Q9E806_SYMMI|nr:hypothetical protein AK812_SmicGene13477 [Symbiodinium microadriaticum]
MKQARLREEKERLLREQAEQARLQQLREAKQRLLQEEAEQTRLQQQRQEKERLLQEQAEQTRLQQLRHEAKEQLLKEQAEQTRLEKERHMQQQAEQARLEQQRLLQEQTEQTRLLQLRQADAKAPVTCATQPTDTLIDHNSQPSSQPIFPSTIDCRSPGEETIDKALRDEEAMQIQRALSREALEEEQAVLLKLKQLQADEARDAEEMAKLQARMQQRQLDSQAQAKAALLARSRSQSSLCSEHSTSAGSPAAPSMQQASRTGTPSPPSQPSAARAEAIGKDDLSPEELTQLCQAQKELLTTPNSRGGSTKQELLRDFVLKCYKQNDYEGNKESRLREKTKSQKTNLVRGWCTEQEMVKLGWNKVKGAMQYCTRHKLTKRCKYTSEEKFLVELEDKVDDELMTRLKLEEEMSAICGDFKDDDPVFAFNLAAALEDDDQGLPASGAGSKKVVLEEWPEILEDNLGLRIKKFKDHAVKRKGVFKTTEDRLLEEKCAGHETDFKNLKSALGPSVRVAAISSMKSSLLSSYLGVSRKIAKTHGTGSGNQFRGLVRSLERLFSYMLNNGYSKLLLGGYDVKTDESRTVLRQWWERYRAHDPRHPVFSSNALADTVPLALYGDEGTGKRKHPCYILATKAMLNCRNNSYYRNFLYTIAAHELYRGFHKGSSQTNECLDEIVRQYSLEAASLFREGYRDCYSTLYTLP